MVSSEVVSLDVDLNAPQWKAFEMIEPNTTCSFIFGRGTGKTELQLLQWFHLVAQLDGVPRAENPNMRGVRIVLLCPSYKQCVDVYAKRLTTALEGKWSFLGGSINRSRWIVTFPGGSSIQFFGAENIGGGLGIRCDVISVDECDDIDPAEFQRVAVPWLTEPWSLKTIIATGTPRRGRHGLLWQLHEQALKKEPGYRTLKATFRDAPGQVDIDYVASQEISMGKAMFDREYNASFDSGEGLVYQSFDIDFHVRPPVPETYWTEVIGGADWGWEHPGGILVLGIQGSGRDAVVHVLEEHYAKHQLESWWIDRFRDVGRRYPQIKIYADPSQPSRIEAARREAGVSVARADNAMEAGIASVVDKLAIRPKPGADPKLGKDAQFAKLYVSPQCQNLIREFGLYRRKKDPKDPEKVIDAIDKRDDDLMDCLRYAIFSRFGRPASERYDHGDADYRYG